MRCPSCLAENAGTRRFCAECGSPLPLQCSARGFENESAAKFCGGCGRPMGQAGLAAPISVPAAPRTDADPPTTVKSRRRWLMDGELHTESPRLNHDRVVF